MVSTNLYKQKLQKGFYAIEKIAIHKDVTRHKD